LEQIFTNLLDNAIKYAPEHGQIYVKLGTTLLNQPDTKTARAEWAMVTISNNGPRLSAEEMPRIFERFYKLDKSRVRKRGDSTGLGLAIVRELVDAHHGQIQVENQPIGATTPTQTSQQNTYAADSAATTATARPYNPATDNLTTFSVYLPLSQSLNPNRQTSPTLPHIR
jgi:signal transduction histidine kinase